MKIDNNFDNRFRRREAVRIKIFPAHLLVYAFLFYTSSPSAELTDIAVPLTSIGFKKVFAKHGVTVYRTSKNSPVTLAAEGIFRAPPDRVRQVLLDYPNHVGAVEYLSLSRVLEGGADWFLVYERLDLPFISNRDYTLRVNWGNKGDTLWIGFRAAPDRGPPKCKKYVRITHHQGSWQLRPIQGGKATMARYMVSIDLAGSLPKWMTGSGTQNEIPNMFVAFRKALASR